MIDDLEELARVREECRALVTKRSVASALAAIVPVPGADVAADIGMLMEMLPAINRRFGLSAEQIDGLDDQTRKQVLLVIRGIGTKFVGKVVTQQTVIVILRRIGIRLAATSIAKYVPIAGTVLAGSISFGAMRWVGNAHVDECYDTMHALITAKPVAGAAPTVTPLEGGRREA